MCAFVALDRVEKLLLRDGPLVPVEKLGVHIDIGILAEDDVEFFLHGPGVKGRVSIEAEHFRDHAADVALFDFGIWLEFPVVRLETAEVNVSLRIIAAMD